MPKSKRNKVVSLTKVKKRVAKDFKEAFVDKIKKNLAKYENVLVFSHQNMTTVPFRQIQLEWKDSKYIYIYINLKSLLLLDSF